ncbi:hypothetical protein PENTCL1PPCAC_10509, partial [Pristionchus entomophagus]
MTMGSCYALNASIVFWEKWAIHAMTEWELPFEKRMAALITVMLLMCALLLGIYLILKSTDSSTDGSVLLVSVLIWLYFTLVYLLHPLRLTAPNWAYLWWCSCASLAHGVRRFIHSK